MIKSVSYFPGQAAANSVPVLSAAVTALRHHGIKVVENSLDADAALIWSVLWAGRMAGNQAVWNHYTSTGRPVIIIDIGALYRGETWKIAVNSITADGYYGHKENLDWDRPRRLGISLAINLSRNDRIVIAAQHAKSLQVQDLISVENWICEQIAQIRKYTDRPITVRPHPRSRLDAECLPKDCLIESPKKITNTYDSYNLAFDCHAMINYNSGPGIQAALAGTRPIVHSSSLAYPVSIDIRDIDLPYCVDRDQWLVEICHTEYTVTEITNGHWLHRLAPALEGSCG